MCKILEGLICSGWEVLTTGEMTVTSGCELFTWILKKSTTPLAEADVVAVAIANGDDSNNSKITAEVVAPREQLQVNNVLKNAADSVSPPSDGDDKKENEDGEKKDGENEDDKRKSVLSKDDPECPPTVELHKSFASGDEGAVLTSKLLLELSHLLFCRQWKLVATAPTPYSRHEVLFFCRDSRILPALGQEAFAMVALQKPDKLRYFFFTLMIETLVFKLNSYFSILRLHHVSEEAEKDIRAAIVDHWQAGLESKEADDLYGSKQYRLLDDPWIRSRRGDGTKRPMVAAQVLASKVLLVLNKRELNLYAKVCLRRGEEDQVTLLIFRQSNVAYTETLTIQPTG